MCALELVQPLLNEVGKKYQIQKHRDLLKFETNLRPNGKRFFTSFAQRVACRSGDIARSRQVGAGEIWETTGERVFGYG